MPKKKKAYKNSKTGRNVTETKCNLLLAEPGQVYGFLEKALGARFFNVKCIDGVMRRCKVRKKRMKVKEGDCVIISLRDFDDKNADVIHRFSSDEVRTLQKIGEIPTGGEIGAFVDKMKDDDDEDNMPFDFEDI